MFSFWLNLGMVISFLESTFKIAQSKCLSKSSKEMYCYPLKTSSNIWMLPKVWKLGFSFQILLEVLATHLLIVMEDITKMLPIWIGIEFPQDLWRNWTIWFIQLHVLDVHMVGEQTTANILRLKCITNPNRFKYLDQEFCYSIWNIELISEKYHI